MAPPVVLLHGKDMTLGAVSREVIDTAKDAIIDAALAICHQPGARVAQDALRSALQAFPTIKPDEDNPIDDTDKTHLESAEFSTSLHGHLTGELKSILNDELIEEPLWLTPVCSWLSRAFLDGLFTSYRGAARLNLTNVPARSAIKGDLSAALTETRNTARTTAAISASVGVDRTQVTQSALPNQLNPNPSGSPTPESVFGSATTASSSEWNQTVKDVHLLVGREPAKDSKFAGNAPHGRYVEWRSTMLDIVSSHPSPRVRGAAILHLLEQPLKKDIKLAAGNTDTPHCDTVLQALDDEFLTVAEKCALQNRWVSTQQSPGQSPYDYIKEFEHVLHLREMTYPGEGKVSTIDKIALLQRGFTCPKCKLALAMTNPSGILDYDKFKATFKSFYSNAEQQGLFTTTTPATAQPTLPTTSAATTNPASKSRQSAKTVVMDTDPCYARVHTAISGTLGIPQDGCLRCSVRGHFARDCTAPAESIHRRAERCGTCGDIKASNSRHHCRISPKRVICSRCNRKGHVAGVCRAPTPGTNAEAPQQSAVATTSLPTQESDPLSKFVGKFPTASARSAIITAKAAAAFEDQTNVRGGSQPHVRLKLGGGCERVCHAESLVDSGANVSLMSRGLLAYLLESKVLDPNDVVALNNDIPVGVADGNSLRGTHVAKAAFSSGQCSGHLRFLVCDGADPDILIGTNMFPSLGLALSSRSGADVSNIESINQPPKTPLTANRAAVDSLSVCPLAEVVEDDRSPGHHRVRCRCEPLEIAPVYPYREKLRRKSDVDQRIEHHRLLTMEGEGKVTRCSEGACTTILATVIVDKAKKTNSGEAEPRRYPGPSEGPESVDSRYRVTLDCRVINRLVLTHDSNGRFLFVPGASVTNESATKAAYRQSEPSPSARLGSIPYDYVVYAKVDLVDAYSCILLPPRLSALFGLVTRDPSGELVWWQFRVLPQGWVWSSVLFNSSMHIPIDRINARLEKESIRAVARHNKDDVIIAALDTSNCEAAVSVAREEFQALHFLINDAKSTPPSSSVNFCGLRLTNGCCTMEPTRFEFTDTTASTAWSEFMNPTLKPSDRGNPRVARTTWLRKWFGVFNYFRGFLGPDAMSALFVIQKAQSVFQKVDEDIPEDLYDRLKKSFYTLVAFYLSGLPGLLATSLGDRLLGTVLLTDSNTASWSAVVLIAVTLDDPNSELAHSASLPVDFPTTDVLFDTPQPLPFALLPAKLTGGCWDATQQRMSSTWRERVAAIEAVVDCVHELQGPTTLLIDNINGCRSWNNIADTFSGAILTKWEVYTRYVTKTVWIPRTGAPRWTDALARSITGESPTATSPPPADRNLLDIVLDPRAITGHGDQRRITVDDAVSLEGERKRDEELNVKAVEIDPSSVRAEATVEDDPTVEGGPTPIQADSDDEGAKSRHIADIMTSGDCKEMVRSLQAAESWITSSYSRNGQGLYVTGDSKVVLPESIVEEVILFHHATIGHAGSEAIIHMVELSFYHPRLRPITLSVLRRCSCAHCTSRRTTKSAGGKMTPARHVLDCVYLDLVGPLEPSNHPVYKKPCRFILSALDSSSGFLWLWALPSSTTPTITAVLERDLVDRYGSPLSYYADNGPQFVSRCFRLWACRTGSLVRYAPRYSPWRNSRLERQHAEVKRCLRALTGNAPSHWSDFLSKAEKRCNRRVVDISNGSATPFFLFFGWDDVGPLARELQPQGKQLPSDILKEATRVHEARRRALDSLLELHDSSGVSVGRRRGCQFRTGDLVMKYFPAGSPLQSKWVGPYSVQAVLGQGTVVLGDGSTEDTHNLRRYYGNSRVVEDDVFRIDESAIPPPTTNQLMESTGLRLSTEDAPDTSLSAGIAVCDVAAIEVIHCPSLDDSVVIFNPSTSIAIVVKIEIEE